LGNPSILLDGTQLLQRRGTGIASYTRTVARSLNSLGARVSLLFGTNSHPRTGDPAFALADQIFCNRPPPSRLAGLIAVAIRSRFGLKRNIDAVEVSLNGVDLTFLDPPLPPFHRIFNADSLFDRSRAASVWGSRMVAIVPPEKFAAYHWTGPVPLKSSAGPNLYTIHDLVPIQFPYLVIDRPGNSARLHAAIARTADGIITVSEASKTKIVELLKVAPERVTVTYQPAPSPSPLALDDAEWIVSNLYNVTPRSYALYLGAVEPKKNLKRLIEAFLLSRLNIPLLMAGPLGWLYDDEIELLTLIGQRFAFESANQSSATTLSKRRTENASEMMKPADKAPIRHLGYLPRRHVTALLQCAKFFVFPSIYEGFGLPALEAMQLRVPVLTSHIESLCEVVGNAALLVDPLDIDDMARQIRVMDADSDLRSELALKGPVQAAKFSEEAYLQKLTEAYGKVGVMLGKAAPRKDNQAEPNQELAHALSSLSD
jgi:glycosyltransferase involved in cell wall biosynthesis